MVGYDNEQSIPYYQNASNIMPIINPPPQPLTPQQIGLGCVSCGAWITGQLCGPIARKFNQWYGLLWNQTPDNVQLSIAAMGTQALAVFTASAQLASLINANGGNVPATSPAGWTVTFGADGAATAVYAAPAP